MSTVVSKKILEVLTLTPEEYRKRKVALITGNVLFVLDISLIYRIIVLMYQRILTCK